MSQELLKKVDALGLKENVSKFEIGDTVNVHCTILEGAKSGGGPREMFTVRRIVNGEGVERKFPLHSPKIAKVEVVRSAVVRRAKLYFLRDRVGKAVRLQERRVERDVDESAKVNKMKRGKKAKAAKRAAKEAAASEKAEK